MHKGRGRWSSNMSGRFFCFPFATIGYVWQLAIPLFAVDRGICSRVGLGYAIMSNWNWEQQQLFVPSWHFVKPEDRSCMPPSTWPKGLISCRGMEFICHLHSKGKQSSSYLISRWSPAAAQGRLRAWSLMYYWCLYFEVAISSAVLRGVLRLLDQRILVGFVLLTVILGSVRRELGKQQ